MQFRDRGPPAPQESAPGPRAWTFWSLGQFLHLLPVTYQAGCRLLLQPLHHLLVLPLTIVLLVQVPEPRELELHAHLLQLDLGLALSPWGPRGPGWHREFRSVTCLALGGGAGFGGL